jgi:hypothetical protein
MYWMAVLAVGLFIHALPNNGPLSSRGSAIDAKLAAMYFQEADQICRLDGGKLWGKSLCRPMMFADPRTRMVVANRSDEESKLTKQGEVYVGKLPDAENIGNTALRWAGVQWTMVMWPLPQNKNARLELMAHELFHRIQDEIGLPASNPSNDHLDSKEGRILLQLEWRALARALTTLGKEKADAVEDALVFRLRRREIFPGSSANERLLEMNEGLAEYTGVKLRGSSEQECDDYVASRLRGSGEVASFVRSFAYVSGPAYGLLLDETGAEWRKGLKQTDDFGDLAARHLGIGLPANLDREAERRAASYDGQALIAAETARDAERQARLANYRRRFVEGPVLVLPLGGDVRFSFDPNDVQAFDETGSVYQTLRVSDTWGILTVSGAALMTRRGQRLSSVTVPAPTSSQSDKIEGDGWTLELNKGWKLEPGPRKGDFGLKASQ